MRPFVLRPGATSASKTDMEEEVGRALLRTPPYAPVVVDVEDRVLFWSAGAELVFGYPVAEVTGRRLHEVLVPGTSPSRPLREEEMEAGSTAGGTLACNVRCRDARWIRVQWTRHPLGEDPGRALLLFKNVSERARAQRTRTEAEQSRALLVLAGEIAHEIRNPLGSIALNLELLEEEIAALSPEGGEPRREEIAAILRRIEEEVRSLRSATDGYLEFARHPLGRHSEVQLREFLEGLVRLLAPELARARVEAATEYAPDLPPVSLDATKFKQVMTNLVRNAVEAMPGGGRLEIRVAFDDRWVRVEIADTGAGIPPDTARRLFEPFFSTKAGGTGLGLLLAREGVQAHEGRLEFRTEMGRGTTFVVSIPRD